MATEPTKELPKRPEETHPAPEPMAELVYVLPDSTKNLPGVAMEVPRALYEHMEFTVKAHLDRRLGEVTDPTRYYNFSGEDYFMRHGLVQVGRAVTTDNEEGFPMMRLFANSVDERGKLEKEIGRYSQLPAHSEDSTASPEPTSSSSSTTSS